MLHGFAQAELASMIDLQAAANLTQSPARRALYIRQALDEGRHAGMFARRSAELRRARGLLPLGPVVADTEHLFERLGELRFLAFLHLGEARARRQLASHIRACKSLRDARSLAVLEAIVGDEAQHEDISFSLLVELAGGETAARRAVRRAALWDAYRLWRRAGRWLAARVYAALMLVVFVAVAPLALLVRLVRPVRAGWENASREQASSRPEPPSERK